MIHLLAQDILAASQSPSAPASWRNVAIGLLSEPAFIHKDRVVRQWLRDGGRAAQDVKLCWLVGTDTVERFFDQKCASAAAAAAAARSACRTARGATDRAGDPRSLSPLRQTTRNRSPPVSLPSSTLQRRPAPPLRSSSTLRAQQPRLRRSRRRRRRRRCTRRRSRRSVCRPVPSASAAREARTTGGRSARRQSARTSRRVAAAGAGRPAQRLRPSSSSRACTASPPTAPLPSNPRHPDPISAPPTLCAGEPSIHAGSFSSAAADAQSRSCPGAPGTRSIAPAATRLPLGRPAPLRLLTPPRPSVPSPFAHLNHLPSEAAFPFLPHQTNLQRPSDMATPSTDALPLALRGTIFVAFLPLGLLLLGLLWAIDQARTDGDELDPRSPSPACSR